MSELSEKVLSALAASDKTSFTDKDLMFMGLSYKQAMRVISELEINGQIEVCHRYVNLRFTLV